MRKNLFEIWGPDGKVWSVKNGWVDLGSRETRLFFSLKTAETFAKTFLVDAIAVKERLFVSKDNIETSLNLINRDNPNLTTN